MKLYHGLLVNTWIFNMLIPFYCADAYYNIKLGLVLGLGTHSKAK